MRGRRGIFTPLEIRRAYGPAVRRHIRIVETAVRIRLGPPLFMSTKQLGIQGEKIAADYLARKGYQILGKNYSPRFIPGPKRGEIDIIARKNNAISFVEVKTLRQAQGGHFSPEEKVDYLKQRKIIKTATSWLMEKKIPLDSKWQIDVIALSISPDIIKLRHLKNAVFQ